MNTIVTLTMNPALDKSSRISQVVANRKLRCQPPRFEPGGGGINVARAVRKLGGYPRAVYPQGGNIGQFLTDLLKKEGLDCYPVAVRDRTRENLTVLETSSGQQYRYVFPGPKLKEDEWQKCLDAISRQNPPPHYIVASGSLPPGVPDDFFSRLASLVKKMGSRLILDTSGPALAEAIEQPLFLIKPNLREFSELIGMQLEKETQIQDKAIELQKKKQVETICISLGSGGVLLVREGKTEQFRTPTVPIRSKVGAGDSMVAGIALALSRNQNIREAVQFGIAAGAAAVMTPGTELCRRKDTESLYEEIENNKKING
ncbi:MAG: 1-phosphofructokinase family hexose kinase [Calditrichaeota bacterium]|nr:1-phosphofructokinase family hexose kinase [Calditrichota bacterium]RQW00945.1 MAG: 1-phosphofructokinase family hexose kinase [Calditrichota bacterium]